MLQNSRNTAFTVSELLRANQQGGGGGGGGKPTLPPTYPYTHTHIHTPRLRLTPRDLF